MGKLMPAAMAVAIKLTPIESPTISAKSANRSIQQNKDSEDRRPRGLGATSSKQAGARPMNQALSGRDRWTIVFTNFDPSSALSAAERAGPIKAAGRVSSHVVIPGRRASVEPGIHTHDHGYGFRAR